jgi:hypothetical protein
MKFTFFNLMPWPHLPVDFRQKHHRSVWVDIPRSLYDPVKGHAVYHTISTSSNTPRRSAFVAGSA